MHSDGSGSTVLFRALPEDLRLAPLAPEEKRALRAFGRTLTRRVAEGRSFTCLITDDAELRRLNSSFLGHDYATDVLSFPSYNAAGDLGEIAISIERAEVQAQEFGHDRIDEICVLMLHGLLHLMGMDHEQDHGQMARSEQRWQEELGLPSNLIARTKGARRNQ